MKWRSFDESAAVADGRPLREQFAERELLISKYVPAEVRAVQVRAIEEIAGKVKPLAIGSPCPQFQLKDQNAEAVSSAEILTRGPLVICFFRGRWCPFCIGQLEAMNAILDRIKGSRASLVAISPQTVQQSFFMADQHKLQFPLLSDAHNKVAWQFGLAYLVPEYQQSIYRRAFINLPFINGDDSWELPIPATYIVDRNGIIRYASANANYTERPEPTDILDSIMKLA